MSDTNGEQNGKDRLDRIERILESLVGEHVQFAAEHKQLLTSQILLTDRIDKLALRMDKLAETQGETEGRMTILIKMMDEWIRRNPDPVAEDLRREAMK